MEIFGGFMVMMSILSFFLAVVWLVMPFVVFTIKGKLDRALDMLSGINDRLTVLEARLIALDKAKTEQVPTTDSVAPDSPRNDGTSILPLA